MTDDERLKLFKKRLLQKRMAPPAQPPIQVHVHLDGIADALLSAAAKNPLQVRNMGATPSPGVSAADV